LVIFSSLVAYKFETFNDTISDMTARRIIALSAGGVTALATFAAGIALLLLGEYSSPGERIIFVSVALAPVAMLAAMVGYAVWWFVLFILTLVLPGPERQERS
jgi:hypothetical protein